MPLKVANALGLTLTKTFGHYYSMENKQVPLVGKIKDVQFAFTSFLEKKIKIIVLVADVPASYGMLLGCNFCKDVGGELHMDMTQAKIPVKRVMQKLIPERETKYTVVKSNDPHAHILFKLAGMGNYYLHIDEVFKFSEEWVEVSASEALDLSTNDDSEESSSSYIFYSDKLQMHVKIKNQTHALLSSLSWLIKVKILPIKIKFLFPTTKIYL